MACSNGCLQLLGVPPRVCVYVAGVRVVFLREFFSGEAIECCDGSRFEHTSSACVKVLHLSYRESTNDSGYDYQRAQQSLTCSILGGG